MDTREKFDISISRLFAMSHDGVLGLRGDTVAFANAAAEALLGGNVAQQRISRLLPDFLPERGMGTYATAVTIGGKLRTVTVAELEDLLILTIPREVPTHAVGTENIVQQLRECAFSMRMALDAAFPPEKTDETGELYASMLYHNQHSLLRLTGALADAAAIADGSLACFPRLMDMAALCEDLVDSVNHFTAGQTAPVEFHREEGIFSAMIDPERMEQLLLQLLCNALQHTPADGRIRMELKRQGQQLILSLDDTGSGIADQQLSELFSGHSSWNPTDLSPKGIGLGLHLAQSIARAHGGTLILRSQEGNGTHIRLMLPAHNRLPLRDVSQPRSPSLLLTELSPVLSHRSYRRNYRD